jgi:hypothetical protein
MQPVYYGTGPASAVGGEVEVQGSEESLSAAGGLAANSLGN